MNAAEQLIAEGELRGKIAGLRSAIETTLSTRKLTVSEVGRARLAACEDVDWLMTWLQRAVTATSEADVFGGPGDAGRERR